MHHNTARLEFDVQLDRARTKIAQASEALRVAGLVAEDAGYGPNSVNRLERLRDSVNRSGEIVVRLDMDRK